VNLLEIADGARRPRYLDCRHVRRSERS
jgi:hypothetical protein